MRLQVLMISLLAADFAGAEPVVSESALRGHVEFLAADSLRGRNAGTNDYQVAADYVRSEFIKLEMKPGGENGRYFQEVPLVEYRPVKGSLKTVIETSAGPVALNYPEQFLMRPDARRRQVTVSGELVFAGYGIRAGNFGHDDYADIDVRGKIVVILDGRPVPWPTEEGAHLGNTREKIRHAVRAGAIGMIAIETPREREKTPWEDHYRYLDLARMDWVGPDGNPDFYHEQMRGRSYVRMEAAGYLFENAPVSLADIFHADSQGSAVATFPLATRASLARGSTHQIISSPNVMGVIEGSDPDLKHEYLTYFGHLDHLGVIRTEAEGDDEIYNGALDNAVGIATLLEAARVLMAERHRLKRSIMFVAVTAEEKGLLGAGYFAANPTVPIANIIANINLDMPILLYPFSDVVAFGAQHSSLWRSVEKAARQAGVKLSPDPVPEQGIFTRSDHYRLVQQGVPAVYLAAGFGSRDPRLDGGEIWQNHLRHDYHKPSDQVSLPIDYEAARVFTEININIGREICNHPARPTWNEGNFFGELFGRK